MQHRRSTLLHGCTSEDFARHGILVAEKAPASVTAGLSVLRGPVYVNSSETKRWPLRDRRAAVPFNAGRDIAALLHRRSAAVVTAGGGPWLGGLRHGRIDHSLAQRTALSAPHKCCVVVRPAIASRPGRRGSVGGFVVDLCACTGRAFLWGPEMSWNACAKDGAERHIRGHCAECGTTYRRSLRRVRDVDIYPRSSDRFAQQRTLRGNAAVTSSERKFQRRGILGVKAVVQAGGLPARQRAVARRRKGQGSSKTGQRHPSARQRLIPRDEYIGVSPVPFLCDGYQPPRWRLVPPRWRGHQPPSWCCPMGSRRG